MFLSVYFFRLGVGETETGVLLYVLQEFTMLMNDLKFKLTSKLTFFFARVCLSVFVNTSDLYCLMTRVIKAMKKANPYGKDPVFMNLDDQLPSVRDIYLGFCKFKELFTPGLSYWHVYSFIY